MSYFVAGFKANPAACTGLESILGEIVPAQQRKDRLRVCDSPYLATYGHQKVIQHLVIHDRDRRSWIVMIGTPLIRFASEEQQGTFIKEFFQNPARFLRDIIDGNFALLAYDGLQERCLAATDFNSTTPVFYSTGVNGTLFSSHELVLAKYLTPEIDPFGFAQAVQLGVPWGSHTRFQKIAKLLPCQILTVDKGQNIRLERYWRPQDDAIWGGNFDQNLEKWSGLLRDAVWKIYDCSNRQPVVADFTAGEDSRLVLAQCHALGIPFTAHVKGAPDDVDVVVAERAAQKVGFCLIKRSRHQLSPEQLVADALAVGLAGDAYLEYSSACSDYATYLAEPLDDYSVVKYCGVPGGEAFRGSYYIRGKAFFPARKKAVNAKFFIRMKYLLDYYPGLFRQPDTEFLDKLHGIVRVELDDVRDYPIGTQIDHLLRAFQTCSVGLMYKDPLYLPLATNAMTRSIYNLSPEFKRWGRLTRACTEQLFPELAHVNTQSGIPTIRRTLRTQAAFLPEYVAVVRKIAKGGISRLFKWKQVKGADASADLFATLLNNARYSQWFSSAGSMLSGKNYDSAHLETLLAGAKTGTCRYSATVGRIIGQELALRWVYVRGVN
jgi:hypothetical protein